MNESKKVVRLPYDEGEPTEQWPTNSLDRITSAVHDALVDQVRNELTPDLLKPGMGRPDSPTAGHCYVSSEAIYHLLGGPKSGLKPVRLRMPDGVVHWWLQDQDGSIIDATHDQFSHEVPYDQGRPGGFLTKEPSARAQTLINRVKHDEMAQSIPDESVTGSAENPNLQLVGPIGEGETYRGWDGRIDSKYDDNIIYNVIDRDPEYNEEFDAFPIIGSIIYRIVPSDHPRLYVEEVFVDRDYRSTNAFYMLVEPVIAAGVPIDAEFENPRLQAVFMKLMDRGKINVHPSFEPKNPASMMARIAANEDKPAFVYDPDTDKFYAGPFHRNIITTHPELKEKAKNTGQPDAFGLSPFETPLVLGIYDMMWDDEPMISSDYGASSATDEQKQRALDLAHNYYFPDPVKSHLGGYEQQRDSGTQPVELMSDEPSGVMYWAHGGGTGLLERARAAWCYQDGTLYVGLNHRDIMTEMRHEGLDPRYNSIYGWIDPVEDGKPWATVTDHGWQDNNLLPEVTAFFEQHPPQAVLNYIRTGNLSVPSDLEWLNHTARWKRLSMTINWVEGDGEDFVESRLPWIYDVDTDTLWVSDWGALHRPILKELRQSVDHANDLRSDTLIGGYTLDHGTWSTAISGDLDYLPEEVRSELSTFSIQAAQDRKEWLDEVDPDRPQYDMFGVPITRSSSVDLAMPNAGAGDPSFFAFIYDPDKDVLFGQWGGQHRILAPLFQRNFGDAANAQFGWMRNGSVYLHGLDDAPPELAARVKALAASKKTAAIGDQKIHYHETGERSPQGLFKGIENINTGDTYWWFTNGETDLPSHGEVAPIFGIDEDYWSDDPQWSYFTGDYGRDYGILNRPQKWIKLHDGTVLTDVGVKPFPSTHRELATAHGLAMNDVADLGTGEPKTSSNIRASKVEVLNYEFTGFGGWGGSSRRPVIYDPATDTAYVGPYDSSHASLIKNLPAFSSDMTDDGFGWGDRRRLRDLAYSGVITHQGWDWEDYSGDIPDHIKNEVVQTLQAKSKWTRVANIIIAPSPTPEGRRFFPSSVDFGFLYDQGKLYVTRGHHPDILYSLTPDERRQVKQDFRAGASAWGWYSERDGVTFFSGNMDATRQDSPLTDEARTYIANNLATIQEMLNADTTPIEQDGDEFMNAFKDYHGNKTATTWRIGDAWVYDPVTDTLVTGGNHRAALQQLGVKSLGTQGHPYVFGSWLYDYDKKRPYATDHSDWYKTKATPEQIARGIELADQQSSQMLDADTREFGDDEYGPGAWKWKHTSALRVAAEGTMAFAYLPDTDEVLTGQDHPSMVIEQIAPRAGIPQDEVLKALNGYYDSDPEEVKRYYDYYEQAQEWAKDHALFGWYGSSRQDKSMRPQLWSSTQGNDAALLNSYGNRALERAAEETPKYASLTPHTHKHTHKPLVLLSTGVRSDSPYHIPHAMSSAWMQGISTSDPRSQVMYADALAERPRFVNPIDYWPVSKDEPWLLNSYHGTNTHGEDPHQTCLSRVPPADTGTPISKSHNFSSFSVESSTSSAFAYVPGEGIRFTEGTHRTLINELTWDNIDPYGCLYGWLNADGSYDFTSYDYDDYQDKSLVAEAEQVLQAKGYKRDMLFSNSSTPRDPLTQPIAATENVTVIEPDGAVTYGHDACIYDPASDHLYICPDGHHRAIFKAFPDLKKILARCGIYEVNYESPHSFGMFPDSSGIQTPTYDNLGRADALYMQWYKENRKPTQLSNLDTDSSDTKSAKVCPRTALQKEADTNRVDWLIREGYSVAFAFQNGKLVFGLDGDGDTLTHPGMVREGLIDRKPSATPNPFEGKTASDNQVREMTPYIGGYSDPFVYQNGDIWWGEDDQDSHPKLFRRFPIIRDEPFTAGWITPAALDIHLHSYEMGGNQDPVSPYLLTYLREKFPNFKIMRGGQVIAASDEPWTVHEFDTTEGNQGVDWNWTDGRRGIVFNPNLRFIGVGSPGCHHRPIFQALKQTGLLTDENRSDWNWDTYRDGGKGRTTADTPWGEEYSMFPEVQQAVQNHFGNDQLSLFAANTSADDEDIMAFIYDHATGTLTTSQDLGCPYYHPKMIAAMGIRKEISARPDDFAFGWAERDPRGVWNYQLFTLEEKNSQDYDTRTSAIDAFIARFPGSVPRPIGVFTLTHKTGAIDEYFHSWIYCPGAGGLHISKDLYSNHRQILREMGIKARDLYKPPYSPFVAGQIWVDPDAQQARLTVDSDLLQYDGIDDDGEPIGGGYEPPDLYTRSTLQATQAATEWFKEQYPGWSLVDPDREVLTTWMSPESPNNLGSSFFCWAYLPVEDKLYIDGVSFHTELWREWPDLKAAVKSGSPSLWGQVDLNTHPVLIDLTSDLMYTTEENVHDWDDMGRHEEIPTAQMQQEKYFDRAKKLVTYWLEEHGYIQKPEVEEEYDDPEKLAADEPTTESIKEVRVPVTLRHSDGDYPFMYIPQLNTMFITETPGFHRDLENYLRVNSLRGYLDKNSTIGEYYVPPEGKPGYDYFQRPPDGKVPDYVHNFVQNKLAEQILNNKQSDPYADTRTAAFEPAKVQWIGEPSRNAIWVWHLPSNTLVFASMFQTWHRTIMREMEPEAKMRDSDKLFLTGELDNLTTPQGNLIEVSNRDGSPYVNQDIITAVTNSYNESGGASLPPGHPGLTSKVAAYFHFVEERDAESRWGGLPFIITQENKLIVSDDPEQNHRDLIKMLGGSTHDILTAGVVYPDHTFTILWGHDGDIDELQDRLSNELPDSTFDEGYNLDPHVAGLPSWDTMDWDGSWFYFPDTDELFATSPTDKNNDHRTLRKTYPEIRQRLHDEPFVAGWYVYPEALQYAEDDTYTPLTDRSQGIKVVPWGSDWLDSGQTGLTEDLIDPKGHDDPSVIPRVVELSKEKFPSFHFTG